MYLNKEVVGIIEVKKENTSYMDARAQLFAAILKTTKKTYKLPIGKQLYHLLVYVTQSDKTYLLARSNF